MFRTIRQIMASTLPGAAGRMRRQDQRLLREAVLGTKGQDCNIFFVCQGNICRSPLASALLRRLLSGAGQSFRVESYGNIPRQGAECPPNAIAAADFLGVDLRPHRSQHFSRAAAERASIVVAFDHTGYRSVRYRYPAPKAPVVMLGNFSLRKNPRVPIADPYGGDLEVFQRTYDIIADAVQGLAQQIREVRDA